MPELSRRLEKVYRMLKKCAVFADIGTDHGLLPIAAVERGKAGRAIASDLRAGPLVKCRVNVERAGIADKLDVRQADGLDGLRAREADAVAICGMGGLLICELLEQGINNGKLKPGTQLILSPNTHEAEVRRLLSGVAFSGAGSAFRRISSPSMESSPSSSSSSASACGGISAVSSSLSVSAAVSPSADSSGAASGSVAGSSTASGAVSVAGSSAVSVAFSAGSVGSAGFFSPHAAKQARHRTATRTSARTFLRCFIGNQFLSVFFICKYDLYLRI